MFKNWTIDDVETKYSNDKAFMSGEEASKTIDTMMNPVKIQTKISTQAYLEKDVVEKTLTTLSGEYAKRKNSIQKQITSYKLQYNKLKFYQIKKKKFYKSKIEELTNKYETISTLVFFITKLYGHLFGVYDC